MTNKTEKLYYECLTNEVNNLCKKLENAILFGGFIPAIAFPSITIPINIVFFNGVNFSIPIIASAFSIIFMQQAASDLLKHYRWKSDMRIGKID